jgi:hypothetical protein
MIKETQFACFANLHVSHVQRFFYFLHDFAIFIEQSKTRVIVK